MIEFWHNYTTTTEIGPDDDLLFTPDAPRLDIAVILGKFVGTFEFFLDVHERTSRRWATGELDIPWPIEFTLRATLAFHISRNPRGNDDQN